MSTTTRTTRASASTWRSAHEHHPTGQRPLSPGARRRLLLRAAVRARPRLQGRDEPPGRHRDPELSGARGHRRPAPGPLRPAGLLREARREAGQAQPPRRRPHPEVLVHRGAGGDDRGALRRQAAPGPLAPARADRLGGAGGRGDRRRPAARRPVLVPLQRPPGRQGRLRDQPGREPRLSRRRLRRAGGQAPQGQRHDLELPPGRADADLSRHGPDRPVHRGAAPWGVRAGALPGARRGGREGARAGLRPAARDARAVRAPVRPLPLPLLHRGDHRGRAGDPAGVAGAVHLRPQPPGRGLGGGAADRP